MPNIYQLTTDFVNLYNQILDSADDETGEVNVDLVTALDSVQMQFEEKALATATVWRMLGEEKERVSNAIKRLTAYEEKLDKEQDRIKETLTQACIATGTEKLRGTYTSISFRKSAKTVVDNIDELPSEFVIEEVKYKADRTAIKKAINEGREVPGAHIELVDNIQIK